MSKQSSGYTEDIVNVLRGLCMGAADIVPGVSGGTMALILGHYERLVSAISRVDRTFIGLLLKGKIGDALAYIDFRFLAALGAGIAIGIVALASLMGYLLENQQAYTYAAFTGLILGSSWLVSRRLKAWKWIHLPLLIVGAVCAWQICLLSPVHGTLTPVTAFFAATVAICAMILPGISGAFVLLLLGLYHPITDLIKGLPRLSLSPNDYLIIVCFGIGCFVGLVAFSRLLKWLLAERHDGTMAFLTGLMLGSLFKIWPFQRVLPSTADLAFKEQQFENIWPSASEANLSIVVGLVVVSAALTLLLERVGSGLRSSVREGSEDSR